MARFLSLGVRLVALWFVCLTGCDRGTSVAAAEVKAPAPGDPIPCFSEIGPVAFTVNGVPVPEATVNRFTTFYRDLGVQNEDKAKARAIEEAILGTAAVYADYRDQGKLAGWSKRVREAETRLKGGEDFAAVAKSASDCPTKAAGGDLGEPFRRDQNVAALTEVAFRSGVNAISSPLVSIYGAHFLKVTGKVDGSSPERDQRKGAHILIAFDPEDLKDVGAYQQKCQKLKKDARVDSVREAYKKLIPTAYRR
jgi:hypothetical protein